MIGPRTPEDTMPHVPLAYWGQELEVKPLKCQNQNNAVCIENPELSNDK